MTGTPGTLTVEAKTLAPLGRPAEGRPLQFQRPSMEAAKPGSRSRSTDVFCGWFRAGAQRAARQAVGPAVFPASAFHGRSMHDQSGTNLAPTAAGKPSTNARPKEMPMKQREPGEPGRTAGGRAWAGNAPVSELRGNGLPYDGPNPQEAQTPRRPKPPGGPNPQDARTTGHLNTPPIEGDDS